MKTWKVRISSTVSCNWCCQVPWLTKSTSFDFPWYLNNAIPVLLTHYRFGRDGSAAMLAAKRSAGVAPEVNLRECVRCTPLPSSNKAAHSGFETQRRHHQKFETGVSVAPKMDTCPTNIKKKTNTLPIWWLRSLEERSTKEKLIAVRLGRKSCTPFLFFHCVI